MKTPTICYSLTLTLLFIISSSSATSHDNFLKCLSKNSQNDIVYSPTNSSFLSTLRFSIFNLRFKTESTPKPQAIITPSHESEIPPIIHCAKESKLQIRTRGGGHDFEGVSSVSHVPFVIIDLLNLNEITVDVEAKTAWVEAGSTLGSLYYKIAEKSPVLGFPAGTGPTVGVGGHFSGGGYGLMLRKYGFSAHNVIDARIVDATGRILDRESMGEDLFWAIRGGGAASFGVVTAWKVQLVDVPEKVTVFQITRTLEHNVTGIIHRWQYVAPKIDKDLFIGVTIGQVDGTIGATFLSLFLGGVDRLMPLMREKFPELGLERDDCTETSWIRSTLVGAGLPIETPLEILLSRDQQTLGFFKNKLNYVQEPIPISGLEGVWRYFYETEGTTAAIILIPYGGRMAEISESATPFPHGEHNLYSLAHYSFWGDEEDAERYIDWSRRLYDYLGSYVATTPRTGYINYRDLDLGVNNAVGETSYDQASVWGLKYFKGNFDRLVRAKTMIDPDNFFRDEQSIPPLKTCRQSQRKGEL